MPAELVALEGVFDLEIRAIREVRSVMAKLGLAPIDLPRYPVRALFAAVSLPAPLARLALANRVAGARGKKAPSLLLDVRARRGRTEVDVLNGAVAAAAARAGVPAPINAAFARILGDISREPAQWEHYRGKPDALIAACTPSA
jgi:2-dehydropantoate 2-reductase